MTQKDFLDYIKSIMDECLAIAEIKNHDYASFDDPFANFKLSKAVGVEPAAAMLVRLTDKLSRISQLLKKPAQVEDESINDSIRDAINYLAILYVYLNHEIK